MPQPTFKALVESMPVQVRADLTEKPICHKVIHDGRILNSILLRMQHTVFLAVI